MKLKDARGISGVETLEGWCSRDMRMVVMGLDLDLDLDLGLGNKSGSWYLMQMHPMSWGV